MRELSLNILDIVQNSIQAKSTKIEIDIIVKSNILTIKIKDNGVGMDEKMVKSVIDPFITTRKTRKVGMGIPLFKMAAENSGGTFNIESKLNKGTIVTATFELDNIDRPPLGNIANTYTGLIAMDSSIRYILRFEYLDKSFVVDTDEIKSTLGEVPIDEYEVIKFIESMIFENISEIGGIF